MLTPDQARKKAKEWGQDFIDFLAKKGLHEFQGWDRLTPAQRQELSDIREEGFEAITEEKIQP